MNAVQDSSEAAILGRVIKPGSPGWSRAAASAILHLGFDETDLRKMKDLLERAKVDTLTESESLQLEQFRRVGRLLEMMKSRARLALRTAGDSVRSQALPASPGSREAIDSAAGTGTFCV